MTSRRLHKREAVGGRRRRERVTPQRSLTPRSLSLWRRSRAQTVIQNRNEETESRAKRSWFIPLQFG